MATAKHRAIDLLRRDTRARAQARGARPRARGPAGAGRAGPRRRARRRRRRRPAAPGVHRLPPGALDRGARRAHAAAARRPDDRRDRARVPRPGADRRPADRAGQADARRGAACRSRCRAATSCAARLSSVLEVIYLIFNEGYSATAGDDWMRPALCEDALRLGRILAELAPRRAGGPRPRRADGDPGVALARARRPVGRAGPAARPGPRALGPAADPPRARRARARRGARRRARPVRAAGRDRRLPRAGARPPAETDWARIAALYDALAAARAVAGRGAEPRGRGRRWRSARRRASSSSTRCADEPSLEGYHLLPSVRGDLLAKLGRLDEARAEFERAASLTRNARERTLLLERAAALSTNDR